MVSSFNWHAGFYQQLIGGISSFKELGNRVVKIAEQARLFRSYETVNEAARILINLPSKEYQAIGHYYLGWCEFMKRGDAKAELERAADYAPARYRALAMYSLAAIEARKQNHEAELSWFLESAKIYPSLDVIRGIAVIKSKEGYHQSALKDLESLLPLLRYAEPFVYYDILNSLAVELGEVGRKYEARNVIKHVLESPFIIAYPEWRETGEELKGPNRSFAVLNPTRRRRKAKILNMPVIEYTEPTEWHKPAPVINLETWKAKMSDKGDELDSRELLLKVVELTTAPGMTDGKLLQVIQFMYKLLIDAPKPDDDDPEAGA